MNKPGFDWNLKRSRLRIPPPTFATEYFEKFRPFPYSLDFKILPKFFTSYLLQLFGLVFQRYLFTRQLSGIRKFFHKFSFFFQNLAPAAAGAAPPKKLGLCEAKVLYMPRQPSHILEFFKPSHMSFLCFYCFISIFMLFQTSY